MVLRRILLCGLLLAGCVRHAQPPEKPRWASQERLEFPVADTPHRLTPLMERELRGCFDFFWNEVVDDPSLPTYGLHNGDYVGLARNVPISIEAHGFYLAMIPAGVERGWVSREQGRQRALTVLKSIKGLKNFHGFYYHFIDPKTGLRGWNDSPNVEVTNAGTATMIAGALAAGEYFGGEVQRLAEELYARIDWRWFLDPKLKHFYLACYPEDAPKGKPVNEQGFLRYHWAAYSEHIIMYVLAAGAPNPQFATNDEPYYAMRTRKGRYKGEEFIYCASGAAFTYQWTHCFVDFRNIVDRKGRNWFENSRRAALAARQFAIDMAGKVKGLGPNSWGMTASMSPTTFYSGRYGSLPAGSGNDTSRLLMDGTVAPCGAIGFVVFTPKESIAALEHMYTIPGLVGKYGLYDAYSFHTKAKGGRPWVGATYLGIDKGVSGLMLENYATQLIWKLVHASPHVQRGLKTLGFRRAEGETSSIQRQGARHLIAGYAADYNVFLAGAAKSTFGDEHSLVDPAPVDLALEHEEFGARLTFALREDLARMKAPWVNPELVGVFPTVGQTIEDALGRPITVDTDFDGRKRRRVVPGPLAEPRPGRITAAIAIPTKKR